MESSTSGAGLDSSLTEYEAEVNSIYVPGSKKQNLSQLLNFHCVPRNSKEATPQRFHNRGGYTKKSKYNKEQFLQARYKTHYRLRLHIYSTYIVHST